jgi:hypothetical protein
MKVFERQKVELEGILKRIQEKENPAFTISEGIAELFVLKMHHQDLIALHKKAIEKIQQLITIGENEVQIEDGIKNEKVEYRNKDFWRSQVGLMLNEKGHPLKSTDIINSYPINPIERRQCMSILSNVLSELCDKGMIKKFKIDYEKGYYYALPDMTIKRLIKENQPL